MQSPAGPIQQIPEYLQAQTQDYQEAKPLDRFLGTDYVHNFIQNHKDVMGFDEEGNIIPGSPVDKIDKAYTSQWAGSNHNTTEAKYWTNEFVKKGLHTARVRQDQHTKKVTSQDFPNRTVYSKATNGHAGTVYYLPSQGEVINGTSGVSAQWIMDHSKPKGWNTEIPS